MSQTAFNNQKYVQLQKEEIYNRIQQYDRLYIEVGGKIFDDHHAARVLPGFNPNVKIEIFKELKDDLEIIFCINARDIISQKIRNDNNLTYAKETIRLINLMRELNINIAGVMINLYESNPLVEEFEKDCLLNNVKTYKSYFIEDYPNDVKLIVSNKGFGKNDHIITNKKIVLVLAPGAGSGKFETCLSQLFLDRKNKITSGYAKYETFPVWNLSIEHLLNTSYEIATADVLDVNMPDPFYKKSYNKDATNYNRDIEAFPLLSKLLNLIFGYQVYNSPTDMGINNVGFAINNDYEVQKACMKEIEKRYIKIKNDYNNLLISTQSFERALDLLIRSREYFNKLKNNQN